MKPSFRSSSHTAMVEQKQRILTSLSRLGDRDTYQIAVADLEKLVLSVSDSPETLPVLLHCLFDSSSDPKPPVKRESTRLLSFLCLTYPDLTLSQLSRIVSHVVRRLKDADTGVRDACRDAIGALSEKFLSGGEGAAMVGLFAKPLFEAMGEQNRSLQSGAAVCMGRMVDSAASKEEEAPLLVAAFQKLCPRIAKLLSSPNYLTKASLLPVVGSLSQVGAIAPQSVESLLQSIHECLKCTDWVTRKAASDVLISLAVHSTSLVADKTDSTLAALEACRFDKIKPVRESLSEALNLWKNIAGKVESGTSVDQKDVSSSEQCTLETNGETDPVMMQGSSDDLSSINSDSISKAVLILRKKAPRLTGKDLNPEFFQKLEKGGSGEMPVEVSLPSRQKNSSSSNTEDDELDANTSLSRGRSKGLCRVAGAHTKQRHFGDFARADETEVIQGEASEGKGHWPPLQRQLLHLERQQTHIMNMLQDFMGGSHDGMRSLESRVRGLERIVEEMSREMSIQSGKYKATAWDGPSSYVSSRNAQTSSRKTRGTGPMDSEQSGNSRRAWDKSSVQIRLGEGPSARSVWQASKDEATLEAIRVAGEEGGGTSRTRRVSIPQAEAIMEDEDDDGDRRGQERDTVWTCWSNAIHALRVGDTDSAFAEVLSTGDDLLLVKLMDKTGPVLDQLSGDIGNEVLNSIADFLPDHTLFDICLSWIQQLLEVSVENGSDFMGIPLELKKEILLNLHEASLTIDPPEDWEGLAPDYLLLQLASNWNIELQHFDQ
ncbi:TORTIFOLIA1-like protein 1 [Hirschfeldia incana]|nr:TORTIFOLIA1-like protein 1 [Hirschfeldia incana]